MNTPYIAAARPKDLNGSESRGFANRGVRCTRIPRSLGAVLIGFLVIGSGAGGEVLAESSARAALDALLNAEEITVSERTLLPLGNQVPSILMTIADDEGEDPLRRTRALSLLRYYSQETTVPTFLKQFSKRHHTNGLLLKPALYAWALGSDQNTVPDLAAFLSSDNPLIRHSAATALAATKDSRAQAILEQALVTEQDHTLKKELQRLSQEMRSEALPSTHQHVAPPHTRPVAP